MALGERMLEDRQAIGRVGEGRDGKGREGRRKEGPPSPAWLRQSTSQESAALFQVPAPFFSLG